MIKCIYCKNEFVDKQFTLEHIFPQSLGGAACPSLFKTRNVCKTCNSNAGLFIDGQFIKSWFTVNFNAANYRRYVNFESECTLPLNYCGIIDELSSENEVCEMWLGPTGDPIYHFHESIKERYSTYAGGGPIDLKKNPGTAFISLATDNLNWTKVVLDSFKAHFKKAKRYSTNITNNSFDNVDAYDFYFDEVTEKQENTIDKLSEFNGAIHKCRHSHLIDHDERFLIKIAIGFGYNILGEPFLNSNYYSNLQKGLWEQDSQKRSVLNLHGTGILKSDKKLANILKWEGGNTIYFTKSLNHLGCTITLDNRNMTVAISDEPALWGNCSFPIPDDGLIYVIIPQINKCVGPYNLARYISFKNGGLQIKELNDLDKIRINLNTLPPFRSDDYPTEDIQ